MTIVQKDTVLHVLCDACADEYRNAGSNIKRDEEMFNNCYEDCEKCGTRKGSYFSIKYKNKYIGGGRK